MALWCLRRAVARRSVSPRMHGFEPKRRSVDFTPLIHKSQERLREIEGELAQFDFAAAGSQERYGQLSKEHGRLTSLLTLWNDLTTYRGRLEENRELLQTETDDELVELIKQETPELEQEAATAERDLKAFLLPPLHNENRDTIVEIRPAAGGDEASLFAGDLFRMYTRYAETVGWKSEILDKSETEVGGIKDVAFALKGENVFRLLRFESGVHRVQRVPETESGGRVHTSTVTVAVLPEAESVDLAINPEDLRVDVFRSSGPGGQSVNTTDSAVRITHLPTGVTVSCQQEKSQHRNRETAMRILRSRLLQAKEAEEAAKSAAARREQVGTGDRSERIRTYNFPQSRITDHRFNITRHDLTAILEGSLGDFIKELRALDVELRLQRELKPPETS